MKGELFTLEDREWAAKNAVKTLENRVSGTSTKIVDIEKVIKYMREKRYSKGLSPQISVLPIRPDSMKEHSYSFTTFYDRANDLIYGKFLGFANNGRPRFKRFNVQEFLDIDLTMMDQAELWVLFCFHPKLEGSVNEENPYFRVFDKSREAIQSNIKADQFMIASGRIRSMQIKDKVYFLRYAYPSRSVLSSYNEEIVNGILYDEAFKNPGIFNRKYESNSRSMFEIFRSALELGVIKNIPEQGYVFENINLGLTEIDVVTNLSKDNVLITSLLDKVSKEDTIFDKVVGNTNNLKRTLDHKDAEVKKPRINEIPEGNVTTQEEAEAILENLDDNKANDWE